MLLPEFDIHLRVRFSGVSGEEEVSFFSLHIRLFSVEQELVSFIQMYEDVLDVLVSIFKGKLPFLLCWGERVDEFDQLFIILICQP